MIDVLERTTNSECATAGHDWAATGLWDNGDLCIPCKRYGCAAELRLKGYRFRGQDSERVISATGFGTAIDGMELDLEDDPQGGVAKIIWREIDRSYEMADLPLVPGDVVLDIGAHVGVVSIYLAKRYPGIRVYAFEPVHENYARLSRNIAANGATGITAINKAVTGDGRRVSLSFDPTSNTGGGSLVSGVADQRVYTFSVTLAQIFADYVPERCALLKIDCEGAEYEILAAGEALLDRVDNLRGEFHINKRIEAQGWTSQKLIDLCARHIPKGHGKITPCVIGE